MAQVRSPFVVPVYDVLEHRGRVHLVMERVLGVDLRAWLDEPRSPVQILRRFREAGAGLQAIHDAGLVHGDFKPANVLLGAEGPARVTDFGLAHDALATVPSHPCSCSGSGVVGTPRYMAPEQWAGASPTPASDQYSFCVALFEALTGRIPAVDDDASAPKVVVGVPRRIVRALRTGLATCPRARHRTMAGLIERLGSVGRPARGWVAMAGLSAAVALVAIQPAAPAVAVQTSAVVPQQVADSEQAQQRDARHEAERERKLAGRHAQARPQLEGLFHDAVASGDHQRAQMIALDLLEIDAVRLHRYDDAERWYRHAHAQLRRAPGSTDVRVQVEQYGAMAAVQAGDGEMARERLELARAAMGSTGTARQRARVENGAAFVDRHQGRWASALEHLEREQALLDPVLAADDVHRATMDGALGGALMALGRHGAAADRFASAIDRLDRSTTANPAERARMLVNLGSAHALRGDFARAAPAFEGGLAVLEAHYGVDSAELIVVLQNLAELSRLRDDVQQAFEYLWRARAIATDAMPTHGVAGKVSLMLAELAVATGKPAVALERLAEAHAVFDGHDPALMAIIGWRQGQARWALGADRDRARAQVEAAVGVLSAEHGGVEQNLGALKEARRWLSTH